VSVGSEFSLWLLLVGMVAGGALTWLVLGELGRRDAEIDERELRAEATWMVDALGEPHLDASLAENVLRAHRRYLGYPPPDALISPEELAALERQAAEAARPEG
jgi:hypothetical protein